MKLVLLITLLIGVCNGLPQGETTTRPDLPWWKTSIIYQIYPRSFKDFSGSGTGDIKGISSKADYLKDLGIGAVWLSPVYASPMADFGYDISSYNDIDPIFGTMEDLDELITELHKRGLKLMMDFVPNHTSDEHEWFQKSVKKIDPYTDYYVWVDAKGMNESGHPIPPNNWLSVFRFSAWTWSEERQQFYLHQFLDKQPDLNGRNPAVIEELDNAIKFWLDKGVDGFRIDAIKHMYEVEDFSLDEPKAAEPVTEDEQDYYYLDHPYTANQPETLEVVRHWYELIHSYENKAMVVEVYDGSRQVIMDYYGTERRPVSDFPFNFDFIVMLANRSDVTGTHLKSVVDKWMDNLPEGKWPNWVLGNHDRSRVASRLGKDLVDSLNMMTLLFKGTPTTYYGEEIGMEDTFVTFEQAKDPSALNFGPDEYTKYGRDPNRSPMQWDSSVNAGFSSASETWLPINENYETVNVASQLEAHQSPLKVYKSLAMLRQNPTFTHGSMTFPVVNDNTFAFLRSLEGEPSYLIVINTAMDLATVDLLSQSNPTLPATGIVELRSSFDERPETEIGSTVDLSSLSLLGSEGIVIRLE